MPVTGVGGAPESMRADAGPDLRPVLIFLHIPKTAGSTLTLILSRQYPAGAAFFTGGPKRPRLEHLEALPMAERERFDCLAGHLSFGVHRLLPRPARYITMVRDPVERLISAFYYIRRLPEHPMHERVRSGGLSLEEYVDLAPSDEQVRILAGTPGTAVTRETLERARRNIEEHFAAIGLTERFEESAVLLMRVLGWRHVYAPADNVTPGRPRRHDLPPSVIATIEEHNRLDRELYSFATQVFDRALREHGIGGKELLRFRLLNRLYGVAAAAARQARRARGNG